MSQDTWEVIKILGGIVLATIIGTLIVVALIRPSDDALANRTNSVVARCGATGQDITTRGWMGDHWNVRCRDSKPYACHGPDVVNCAER